MMYPLFDPRVKVVVVVHVFQEIVCFEKSGKENQEPDKPDTKRRLAVAWRVTTKPV
jgi:hypothetical protein